MRKNKIETKKLAIIFIIGAIVYMWIESFSTGLSGVCAKQLESPYTAFRGVTSIWMGLVGGFLLLILGQFNERSPIRHWTMNAHALLGAILITLVELVSGIILNLWLGFNIWSYAGQFGNFLGQICLQNSLYWLLISPTAFWLDDLIRYYIYGFDHSSRRELYRWIDYYIAIFTEHNTIIDRYERGHRGCVKNQKKIQNYLSQGRG